MNRLFPLALVALASIAVAACGAGTPGTSSGAGAPLISLDETFEPLRKRFNDHAGHRRLVIAVAPTCQACLEGIEAVREQLLDRLRDTDLRVYVVWMPIMSADSRDAARRASAGMPGDRTVVFWDRRRWLGEALGATLQLPPDALATSPDHGIAWDVYLLYDRDQRWDGQPPAPAFWMQRLEGARELAPRFDADALAERVLATDW